MAWLSGWQYRREVPIDNTGDALTDYQIKVNLDNTNFDFSKAKSDGSDVRITDSDGTTLLNYWIESWDSSGQTATLWAKVPSIPASCSIYIYYGNSEATSVSNGDNTFLAFIPFDNYNDGDLNGQDNWYLGEDGFQSWNVQTSVLNQGTKAIESAAATDASVSDKDIVLAGNLGVKFWARSADASIDGAVPLLYTGNSVSSQAGLVEISSGYVRTSNGDGAGGLTWTNLIDAINNTWYSIEVLLDYTNHYYDIIVNGILYNNSNNHFGFRHAPSSQGWIRFLRDTLTASVDAFFDTVFFFKHASPEPTISVGTEETGLGSIVKIINETLQLSEAITKIIARYPKELLLPRDWKKGRAPWKITPVTKVAYNEGNLIATIDNPVWGMKKTGIPISKTHQPTGYWFKGYVPPYVPPTKPFNIGTLWATGMNDYGQLGLSGITQEESFTEVGDIWRQVAVGYKHTVAIKKDGTLWATGMNNYGQLGLGDTTNRYSFELVSFDSWKQVSCGTYFTLAIKEDGTLWATGYNGDGQLGLGDNNSRNVFTQAEGLWRQVSCGGSHTLAIKEDNTLWATGNDSYGQLGFDYYSDENIFTQVGGSWKQVACGGGHFTLATKEDGTLWATGFNDYGQLGLGNTTSGTPFRQVEGLWEQVACGGGYTMALKADGTLWATGRNDYGVLGLGDENNRLVFTQVGDLWEQVFCGYEHAFALKEDGTLWAVGRNSFGQLGLGNTTNRSIFTQAEGLWLYAAPGSSYCALAIKKI